MLQSGHRETLGAGAGSDRCSPAVEGAGVSMDELFQRLAEVPFFVVFLVTTVQFIRRPNRVTMDMALLFGAPAIQILMSWARLLFGVTFPPEAARITEVLLMALPYLLIRLLDDFTDVPRLMMCFSVGGGGRPSPSSPSLPSRRPSPHGLIWRWSSIS